MPNSPTNPLNHPVAGSNPFSQNQLTFAAHLIGGTGLSGGVVLAWMAAEEPVGASQNTGGTGHGPQNWLNIGITGSGNFGNTNSIWNDPAAAGDATSAWIHGKTDSRGVTAPSYGPASAGIQGILRSTGSSPQAQIQAISGSGWAGSGYAGVLTPLYNQYAKFAPTGTASAGGAAGLGGTGTGLNAKPAANFIVGDSSNPHEDYWSGINRLAQDRYWLCFSDGETLYLADGPDLMAQAPVASVDRVADADRIQHLEFTYDNTAFNYSSTHKKRTHVQRRSTVAKISSSTQATLELICDIDEVRAGDVVVLYNCGPADGRWLVGECERSIFDVFSTITLVPAFSPLTEQQVAGAGTISAGQSVVSASGVRTTDVRNAVVAAAKSALGFTSGYAQVRPYPGSLAAAAHSPTDCSGFATLCYKQAGAPDPNGLNYNGQGFTGTLEAHGHPTKSPQPGDLAFWSAPDHVAVMVDSKNIIEWGSPPGPRALTVSQENGFHAAFLGYRSYL